MPSKRQRQKDIKKKMLYNQTLSNMRKYVNNLESKKTQYVEIAKKAQINGSKEQYNLAINGLKMTLAYQKKAKEMLLNFELTMQMRDLSSVTGEFVSGMVSLSKDMTKIISKQDYGKVQESFETAMGKVEEQNIQIDDFLTNTQMSFDNIGNTADPSNVTDAEIRELVDFETKEEIKSKDDEIDVKIEEIEKLLSDL